MATRSLILSRAFGRIGIGSYEFDIEPDEKEMARAELDAMLAEWGEEGIDLGYVPPADADNDAIDLGTPTWADGAIWNNLALRLAPEFGKMPSPQLTREARKAYNLAVGKTMIIPAEARPRLKIISAGTRTAPVPPPGGSGGAPVPPLGYGMLVDDTGAYLMDESGNYLVEPLA